MVLTYLHLLDPESFPLKITRTHRTSPQTGTLCCALSLTAILDQPIYGGDPILGLKKDKPTFGCSMDIQHGCSMDHPANQHLII